MTKTPIGAAWLAYRRLCVHENASETQVAETETAFYAGALILYETIINNLTEGDEVEDADMAMMENIHAEFERFGSRFDQKVLMAMKPGGRA